MYFCSPKSTKMKKILLIFATALMMVSCGQNNKEQSQVKPGQENKYIPTGVLIAPVPHIELPKNTGFDPTVPGNPNGPILKMEEGNPLDFSQILNPGGSKSVGDQVAAQIDSIRYKAEKGEAKYQYAYGVCYENGWGVEQNPKEALSWYRKAAAQENGPAFNSIGNFYRTGTGVTADPKKAFEWYQKGTQNKDVQAMLNLGNCYYYGMGTKKNEQAAVKWWKEAADNGNAYAQAQMGDSYYFGLGVEKDLSKAIEYYTPAAEKNISSAQYRLGLLYYSGNGVEQDQTYAKLLMQKARDGGMKEAEDFLEKNFEK